MPNHLVWIILDSCRFDSFERAQAPNLKKVGRLQRRYSYASWTSPSHFVMLMGMLPHQSPKGVFASEVYKKEYSKWVDRLAVPGLAFRSFVPQLWLPKLLQDLGYHTVARVSMPVLNPFTPINRNFDDYRLMSNHSDFKGIIESVAVHSEKPTFFLLNLGETHYPYMLPPESLPHVSGVHGVLKRMDDDPAAEAEFFSQEQMDGLHQQQVRCVEYVDTLFSRLVEKVPDNTYFIITADHGELFGENDYFGHGPIMHEKVFEVPFIEGLKPGI